MAKKTKAKKVSKPKKATKAAPAALKGPTLLSSGQSRVLDIARKVADKKNGTFPMVKLIQAAAAVGLSDATRGVTHKLRALVGKGLVSHVEFGVYQVSK